MQAGQIEEGIRSRGGYVVEDLSAPLSQIIIYIVNGETERQAKFGTKKER